MSYFRSIIIFCLGFLFASTLIFAGELENYRVRSPLYSDEVFIDDNQELEAIQSLVLNIDAQLMVLAKYMGKTINKEKTYLATQVPKRVLYFEARRLYSTLLQLQYEVLGTRPYVVPFKADILVFSYAQIKDLLVKSTKTLRKISDFLALAQDKEKIKNTPLTNVLVFDELIVLNQVANDLLEVQAQPRDVFQNISLGVYYAGSILKKMPNAKLITKPYPYIPNLKPQDVFFDNFETLKKINEILVFLNYESIKVEILPIKRIITPSDAQLLSELILSELYLICSKMNIDVADIRSYYPGKKYPSDVYQRSTILKQQVDEILQFIKSHPQWLKEHKELHEQ